MSEAYLFFDIKELSKEGPSNDPKDIPFANFICKLCGKILMLQTGGFSYSIIPDISFEEKIHKLLMQHLILFHTVEERIKFLKKEEENET